MLPAAAMDRAEPDRLLQGRAPAAVRGRALTAVLPNTAELHEEEGDVPPTMA